MKLASEVLWGAAELCARGWTQGMQARDAHGHRTGHSDARAARWCQSGARAAAARRPLDVSGSSIEYRAVREALLLTGTLDTCAVNYNDAPSTTQEDVVCLLMTAGFIAECMEEGTWETP